MARKRQPQSASATTTSPTAIRRLATQLETAVLPYLSASVHDRDALYESAHDQLAQLQDMVRGLLDHQPENRPGAVKQTRKGK